jgi:hypothetical protein
MSASEAGERSEEPSGGKSEDCRGGDERLGGDVEMRALEAMWISAWEAMRKVMSAWEAMWR